MIPLAFGIFGLIVGSFLNVLVIRHGVRGVGGRSACMHCGRQLPWFDMVPVASWLVLTGRCRECRARISIQYPLVEAATAVLFGLVGASALPIPAKILGSAIMAVLVAIAVYDLRHTIIPDAWVWSFNALALLALIFNFQFSIFNFLAGPLAALPLFAFWFFSRGRWMGLGDAKLALGIGWLLPPLSGIVAVFGAFIIGAIVSVCILLPLPYIARALYTLGITSKHKHIGGFTMSSEIPFGPFLILSCLIVWVALLYNVSLPQLLMLYE